MIREVLMQTFIKGLGCLFVLMIVLIVAGIATAYRYRGPLLQRGAEKLLTEYMQTPVSLGKSDIRLSDGYVAFKDIKIKNPAGFSDGDLFTIGSVSVKFVPESINTSPFKIESLSFENLNLLYEYENDESNFMVFMKNTGIHRIVGNVVEDVRSESKNEDDEKEPEADSEKSLLIEDFSVLLSKITVIVNGDTFIIPLPDIRTRDIGKDKAIAPEDSLTAILRSIPAETWLELDKAKDALEKAGATKAAEMFDELSKLRK